MVALQDGYFIGDTLDLTPEGRETLVHEMTHAYQYQTGGWGYAPEALWAQFKSFVTTGDRGGAYDWKPQDAAGVPWEQWNPEQQAQCVEDYNTLLRKQQAHQPLTRRGDVDPRPRAQVHRRDAGRAAAVARGGPLAHGITNVATAPAGRS